MWGFPHFNNKAVLNTSNLQTNQLINIHAVAARIIFHKWKYFLKNKLFMEILCYSVFLL